MFKKPKRIVNRVFIHCSASDNPAHDNIQTMTQWHLERGFKEVGYHFFIKKDGQIQIGRSLEKTGAHAKNHNTGTIGICLHGLKKENFTQTQFNSLSYICHVINDAYNGKITFHGHREVAARDCPVFDYKKVLNLDSTGKILK